MSKQRIKELEEELERLKAEAKEERIILPLTLTRKQWEDLRQADSAINAHDIADSWNDDNTDDDTADEDRLDGDDLQEAFNALHTQLEAAKDNGLL